MQHAETITGGACAGPPADFHAARVIKTALSQHERAMKN